ncbi:MAG: HAD family phosphatase, partial [Endomicrobia bacterium]|nr:HAD family phosphatase [Endomicrobiia bacterium]
YKSMVIKAIIFDWGGVVIKNPADGILKFCADYLKVDKHKLECVYSKYRDKFQKGKIKEKQLFDKIISELNLHIKIKPGFSLWKKAVENVFQINKNVLNLIKKLKAQNYKIAILSNTEAPTVEYFYESGLDKYFDVKVFSCEVGFVKPQKEIYKITLKKLKAKPQEVIFIDDNKEYVNSAKKIKINAVLFKNFKKLICDLKFYITNLN